MDQGDERLLSPLTIWGTSAQPLLSPLSSGTKACPIKLVGRHMSPRISVYMLVYMGIHQVCLAPMAMFSNVFSHPPIHQICGRFYTSTTYLDCSWNPPIICVICTSSLTFTNVATCRMGSRARKNWSTWVPLKKKRKLLHLTVLTDGWGGGGPSAICQA